MPNSRSTTQIKRYGGAPVHAPAAARYVTRDVTVAERGEPVTVPDAATGADVTRSVLLTRRSVH